MPGLSPKQQQIINYLMQSQDPFNGANNQDARRSYSQGLSQALLGSVPGAGVAGAAGYAPAYGNNYFIPNGVDKGPSIKDNLDQGNLMAAALQGVGLLPDVGYAAALGSMVPKSAQRGSIRIGDSFPDPDTFRGRMEIQGGSLSSKPGINRITRVLDEHGMEWKYSDNGSGITAYVDVKGPNGEWFKEGKHFAENTSLKTLRDWLGY